MIDSVYWVWFQLVFGMGTRRAQLFMDYFENPKIIYDRILSGDDPGMLTPEEINACKPAMEQAKNIQARTLMNKGCDIITPDHPAYPKKLLEIYSKPAALYIKGDLGCLNKGINIAMVGTREHTEYGKRAAWKLAEGLAANGVTVVSGLAKGIDTFCHEAALKAGGTTVGVMGCGLDKDYPKGNAPLKTRMAQNGAVITEFPLGTQAWPGNFPVRNRIISGMCHGTVVVEAKVESGSIITAEHAMEQNRDIFAVPGDIFSPHIGGSHALLKDGAKLVESAWDILEEYNLSVKEEIQQQEWHISEKQVTIKEEKPASAEIPLPEELSEPGRRIYALLKTGPSTVDELAAREDMGVAQLHTALTELEIYRLISLLPGRRFVRSDSGYQVE